MKRQRAAFRISSVGAALGYGEGAVKVLAHPVMVEEDKIPEADRFHKYTPSGELSIIVTNPDLVDSYHEGDVFYMDMIPVD